MKKATILFLFILFSFFGKSQNTKKVLSSNKSLKEKATLLQDLANDYTKTKFDSAIYCAELADSLIQLTSNIEEKSNSKSFLALLYVAEPDKSMDAAYKNLELCKQSKNCKLISQAYLLLARVNWFIRNDQKVFYFFNLALKEAEKCNNKEALADVYYKGSEFYFNTKQYDKSKEFTFKLATVDTSRKNNPYHYADIGDIFRALKKLDSADYYYNIAVKMAESKKDTFKLANIYSNYALIPRSQKKYDIAIQYCNKAISYAELIGNFMLVENSTRQLIDIYQDKGDYKNAKILLEKRMKLNSGMKLSLLTDLEKLGDINYNLGDYKTAYENINESFIYYKELKSGEASSNLNKIEENHLKKEKQLEIDLEKKEKESEKKMKNISFIGLLTCLILAVFIFIALLNLRKSKKIILKQKNEVEGQKHLIEEKQKEIVDSITYAKRLQEAILPAQEIVNKHLPENFILYTPKDLVAGDFYWMEVINDGDKEYTFIAAADSTGHGVPGAMVSVVCSNALNRAVLEFKLIQTGKILDKTRDLVLETFSKSTTDVKDGMDISLLAVIRKNNEIVEINWSGANNPLWFIENNEVKELKANKQPIGKTDNPTPFTTNSIPYIKGTSFYLFTDGYADQFGGPKGKKFKYKQLEDLLLELSIKAMSVQKETLHTKFEEWKSGIEQVDDVCVIGIKL